MDIRTIDDRYTVKPWDQDEDVIVLVPNTPTLGLLGFRLVKGSVATMELYRRLTLFMYENLEDPTLPPPGFSNTLASGGAVCEGIADPKGW